MKIVQVKRLLVIQNEKYEEFSEVNVNVNDLYINNRLCTVVYIKSNFEVNMNVGFV